MRRVQSFASGENIADNLKSFAKQRNDIFGSTEEEESQLLAEHRQQKSRDEENQRVIWDGSASTASAQVRYDRHCH